jgi:hypothetical protein
MVESAVLEAGTGEAALLGTGSAAVRICARLKQQRKAAVLRLRRQMKELVLILAGILSRTAGLVKG